MLSGFVWVTRFYQFEGSFLPWLQNFTGGFFYCWWLKRRLLDFFLPPGERAGLFDFDDTTSERDMDMVTIVAVHEDDGNGDDYGDDWSRG